MLRHSASEFLGETVDQVDDGAILKCVSKHVLICEVFMS